jgi:hypothetical protein
VKGYRDTSGGVSEAPRQTVVAMRGNLIGGVAVAPMTEQEIAALLHERRVAQALLAAQCGLVPPKGYEWVGREVVEQLVMELEEEANGGQVE